MSAKSGKKRSADDSPELSQGSEDDFSAGQPIALNESLRDLDQGKGEAKLCVGLHHMLKVEDGLGGQSCGIFRPGSQVVA